MKLNRVIEILLAALLGLTFAYAGDLEPPGAPGPTMKTLEDIEGRTPVQDLPGSAEAVHVVSEPGSYYLTANLTGESGKHGILIETSDVMLDLRGFHLAGVAGSLDGIHVQEGVESVIIRHGTIKEWGEDGYDGRNATNVFLEALTSRNNTGLGIYGGWGLTVADSGTFFNGDHGIFASRGALIRDTKSESNSRNGIFIQERGEVRDCSMNLNGVDGIRIQGSGVIHGCTASENGHHGINGGEHVLVVKNVASGNNDWGILLVSVGARAERNVVGDNSNGGIRVSDWYIDVQGAVVKGNQVHRNGGPGIATDAGGRNLIIGNVASQNTVDFDVPSGNTLGQVIDTTATGTITTGNPWANIIY